MVGEVYELNLKGEFMGHVSVASKEIINVNLLTEATCYLDTGYSSDETIEVLQTMYPGLLLSDMVYIYTLHKVEQDLLGSWVKVL